MSVFQIYAFLVASPQPPPKEGEKYRRGGNTGEARRFKFEMRPFASSGLWKNQLCLGII
jgi:hypothetical protein